jgi:hypothetical protein
LQLVVVLMQHFVVCRICHFNQPFWSANDTRSCSLNWLLLLWILSRGLRVNDIIICSIM